MLARADLADHPAAQQPAYADPAAVARSTALLERTAPLVGFDRVRALALHLAEVAAGRAFLLQGGDCAESLSAGPVAALGTAALLDEMAARIAPRGQRVVRVARIAGQYAKPRSVAVEEQAGATLPAYRGDMINGAAFDARARTADPRRMLAAWRASRASLSALARLSDPPFTSHEGLLLPYERALVRRDPVSGALWAGSAAMLWIGERTRQLDGAHVAFATRIANPIGLKCGPELNADELLRLIDRIDPANRPGRLTLIGRFGADRIADRLPALMAATRREGRAVIWAIDPMHGNGRRSAGRKTRALPDILSELDAFFAIAASEGGWPGGVHLELTPDQVTECLGGSEAPVHEQDLAHRYWTYCDPRLNRAQSLDLARAVAARMRW